MFNFRFEENLLGPYVKQLKCFSAIMMGGKERNDVNKGGKIILPSSALDHLTRLHIEFPMLFKLTNTKKNRHTHCGVLEFIAEEGRCYLPFWMMKNLLINEGDIITVSYTTLQVAHFAKFQPQSVDFLEISHPNLVLASALRNFACLTKGDLISINYLEKDYELCILETRPGDAVSIIECDMDVDFAPPVGYQEPTTSKPQTSVKILMAYATPAKMEIEKFKQFSTSLISFFDYLYEYRNNFSNFSGNMFGGFKTHHKEESRFLSEIVGKDIKMENLTESIVDLYVLFFEYVSNLKDFLQNKIYEKFFDLLKIFASNDFQINSYKFNLSQKFILNKLNDQVVSEFTKFDNKNVQDNLKNLKNKKGYVFDLNQQNIDGNNIQKHRRKLQKFLFKKLWYNHTIKLQKRHLLEGTTPQILFFNKFPKPYLPTDTDFVIKHNKIIEETQIKILNLIIEFSKNKLDNINEKIDNIRQSLLNDGVSEELVNKYIQNEEEYLQDEMKKSHEKFTRVAKKFEPVKFDESINEEEKSDEEFNIIYNESNWNLFKPEKEKRNNNYTDNFNRSRNYWSRSFNIENSYNNNKNRRSRSSSLVKRSVSFSNSSIRNGSINLSVYSRPRRESPDQHKVSYNHNDMNNFDKRNNKDNCSENKSHNNNFAPPVGYQEPTTSKTKPQTSGIKKSLITKPPEKPINEGYRLDGKQKKRSESETTPSTSSINYEQKKEQKGIPFYDYQFGLIRFHRDFANKEAMETEPVKPVEIKGHKLKHIGMKTSS